MRNPTEADLAHVVTAAIGRLPEDQRDGGLAAAAGKLAAAVLTDDVMMWDLAWADQYELAAQVEDLIARAAEGKPDTYAMALVSYLTEHLAEQLRRYLRHGAPPPAPAPPAESAWHDTATDPGPAHSRPCWVTTGDGDAGLQIGRYDGAWRHVTGSALLPTVQYWTDLPAALPPVPPHAERITRAVARGAAELARAGRLQWTDEGGPADE